MLKHVLIGLVAIAGPGWTNTIHPTTDANGIVALNFRLSNPAAVFFQQFSYDLKISLDFAGADPFSGPQVIALADLQTGTIGGNAGLFGVDDPDYHLGILSGYATSDAVNYHFLQGRLTVSNQTIDNDAYYDPFQENAFGFVVDLFFDADRTVYVLPQVLGFRDRLFNDQGYFENDLVVTDVSSPPVVTPPAAAVPEPATWAMLVLGFGLVGLVSRRRASALRPARASLN